MLAQNNATEEERHANPMVWMGWKGFKPKNINRRSGSEALGPTWSLDDAAVGSYMCVLPHKASQYYRNPKFEIVCVTGLPEDVSSDLALLDVEFYEFDR